MFFASEGPVCTTMWRPTILVHLHFYFLLAISDLHGCLADGQGFQWKFSNLNQPTSLTECSSYPIVVESRTNDSTAIGQPPYFMIAYLPSGVPTKSNIGSNASNLSWTVDQPAGSPLMLSVVDAQGESSGQPSYFLTVADGASSCEASPPSTIITIATNFSSPITTCQQLGFTINGGKKPYIFSLVELNSTILTEVTMGEEDDLFTYIDRTDPGTQLMASVSDANGVFARSTQLFQTTGSTDLSCPGLISSSGKSPPPPKHHSNAAIPIAMSLVAALLLLATAFLFFYRRRRDARRFRKAGAAILPDAWVGPSTTPGAGPSEALALNEHHNDENAQSARDSKRAMSMSERHRDAGRSFTSQQPQVTSPQQSAEDDSSEIVIQHRDGGRVRELPPPYFHDLDNIDEPFSATMAN